MQLLFGDGAAPEVVKREDALEELEARFIPRLVLAHSAYLKEAVATPGETTPGATAP